MLSLFRQSWSENNVCLKYVAIDRTNEINSCPTPDFVIWQIALLVAGINYVLEVEATLDRVDTGDNSALTGYHDLQVSAF